MRSTKTVTWCAAPTAACAQLRSAIGSTVVLGTVLGLSQTVPADTPAKPNPQLVSLRENSWMRVADGPKVDAGIMAYSGGTFDTVNHKFLIFGGRHADYWGNDVWAFDPAALAWRRMYEPDAQAKYTNDNIDNEKGKLKNSDKPYTRHSYNQLCFVTSLGSMFICGGCRPGWGNIKPTCPVPSDNWLYSFKDNQWTLASAGKGPPTGYDSKRDKVWAIESPERLKSFDLKTKSWTDHTLKPAPAYLGTYNYQMAYLAGSDRLLVIGGGNTCTINPDALTLERHPLEKANGKMGLTYLPDMNVALYVELTDDAKYRMAVFDEKTKTWKEWPTESKPVNKGRGTDGVWNRLQYDPVNKVALLVTPGGVWAFKPPKQLSP
jgi:hypothetical protein